MKKILVILAVMFAFATSSFAQEVTSSNEPKEFVYVTDRGDLVVSKVVVTDRGHITYTTTVTNKGEIFESAKETVYEPVYRNGLYYYKAVTKSVPTKVKADYLYNRQKRKMVCYIPSHLCKRQKKEKRCVLQGIPFLFLPKSQNLVYIL